MINYLEYELADALMDLEYTDEVPPERLRITLVALLDKITKLESALKGHGHDGFRTY